jgi:hypothetical protein
MHINGRYINTYLEDVSRDAIPVFRDTGENHEILNSE